MLQPLRQLSVFGLALVLCIASAAGVLADSRDHDLAAYRQYRAINRERAAQLCDLWFAAYRPGTVGHVYLAFAARCDEIDLTGCSPAMRRFIHRASRASDSVGELFGQGTTPDMSILLISLRNGLGAKGATESPISSDRGRRILELIQELESVEVTTVRELGLDQ